jgi:hypothetical protein
MKCQVILLVNITVPVPRDIFVICVLLNVLITRMSALCTLSYVFGQIFIVRHIVYVRSSLLCPYLQKRQNSTFLLISISNVSRRPCYCVVNDTYLTICSTTNVSHYNARQIANTKFTANIDRKLKFM